MPFEIKSFEGYLNQKDIVKPNFRREKARNSAMFEGEKIVLNRQGNYIYANYINFKCYFSTYLFFIKLKDKNLYPLFTAILNSQLINYFLTHIYRMRLNANYNQLNNSALKNIPIPTNLDENIFLEISEISKNLTKGLLKFEKEIKEKLNDLVYDLFELSYYEKQRVKDFYISDKIKLCKNGIIEYKQTLSNMFELYFEETPLIESYIDNIFGSGTTVVAIHFNGSNSTQVSTKDVLIYSLEEIFKSNTEKFSLLQNRIVGKDCVYLIKNSILKNWSVTKAYEHAKDIIKIDK